MKPLTPLLIKSTQQFINQNFFGVMNEPLVEDGVTGSKTKRACDDIIIYFKNLFKVNVRVWESINIIGIRTNKDFTDKFTDWVVYVSDDGICAVPASTKAGKYYVQNPISYGGVTGTAVLVAGYYKNIWVFKTDADWKTLWLGMPYFQQVNNCIVGRDGDKDNMISDKIPTQSGQFGINHHHAGIENVVYNWSAGCQIVQKHYWTDILQCVPFVAGRLYSYTLISK